MLPDGNAPPPKPLPEGFVTPGTGSTGNDGVEPGVRGSDVPGVVVPGMVLGVPGMIVPPDGVPSDPRGVEFRLGATSAGTKVDPAGNRVPGGGIDGPAGMGVIIVPGMVVGEPGTVGMITPGCVG